MIVLVLDTETANTIEQPMPYDFGWGIVDTTTGEILCEKSFVCAEIFLDKEMMNSAYFAEKVPSYWEDIKNHKRTLKGFWNIRKEMLSDMKHFKVEKVGAYNMGFDKRASINDSRFITGSFLKWFFPYGTEFFCIWHMACTSILNTEDYVRFAYKNNLVSEKGNIYTNAECAYKYITNNLNFTESHTGLEDVKIEIQIMMECIRKNSENMKDNIYTACWQIVQRKRKEIDLCDTFI